MHPIKTDLPVFLLQLI